jgi:hypothetical protein
MEQRGLEEGEAHLLASLSEGSPGKALEIQEEIHHLPRGELLREWVGLRRLSFEKMERWLQSFPLHRENLLLVIEVAKTLLRDLIVVRTLRQGSKLIHLDLLQEIEMMAETWSLPSLLSRIETLHQTMLAIRSNANIPLALEAMMLSWAEG